MPFRPPVSVTLRACAALFAWAAALGAVDSPAAPKAASPLAIEAIRVTPASPAPDTLCHLAITLRNSGDRTASRLELRVKVGGVELPAYRGRVFLATVPPHGTLELPLLNFWSTESSRPAPAARTLPVEVTLVDARWVERTMEGGVETWRPVAPATASAPPPPSIPGLPSARTITLTLAAPPTAPRP